MSVWASVSRRMLRKAYPLMLCKPYCLTLKLMKLLRRVSSLGEVAARFDYSRCTNRGTNADFGI